MIPLKTSFLSDRTVVINSKMASLFVNRTILDSYRLTEKNFKVVGSNSAVETVTTFSNEKIICVFRIILFHCGFCRIIYSKSNLKKKIFYHTYSLWSAKKSIL